jgi:hypothetical protein
VTWDILLVTSTGLYSRSGGGGRRRKLRFGGERRGAVVVAFCFSSSTKVEYL